MAGNVAGVGWLKNGRPSAARVLLEGGPERGRDPVARTGDGEQQVIGARAHGETETLEVRLGRRQG